MEFIQILANAATMSFWNFAIALIVIAICAKFIVDVIKYVLIFLGFILSLFVPDYRTVIVAYLVTKLFPDRIEELEENIQEKLKAQSSEVTDN